MSLNSKLRKQKKAGFPTRGQRREMQVLYESGPQYVGGSHVQIQANLVKRTWARFLDADGGIVHDSAQALHCELTPRGRKAFERVMTPRKKSLVRWLHPKLAREDEILSATQVDAIDYLLRLSTASPYERKPASLVLEGLRRRGLVAERGLEVTALGRTVMLWLTSDENAFFSTWRTSDGRSFPLTEMSSKHLVSTIKGIGDWLELRRPEEHESREYYRMWKRAMRGELRRRGGEA